MISGVSRRIVDLPMDFLRRLSRGGPDADTAFQRGHISDARTATRYSRKAGRLCNTFFLALPADEALAALRNLALERFALEFVTIPADGGCVVAVFAPTTDQGALLSRLWRAREQQSVTSLLASIGATAVT